MFTGRLDIRGLTTSELDCTFLVTLRHALIIHQQALKGGLMSLAIRDVKPETLQGPRVEQGAEDLSREVRNNDEYQAASSWWRQEFSLANVLSCLLLVGYAVAFVRSLGGRWFSPEWTTDDATQQTYPFFDALYPDRFDNDLVSEAMRGSLPPLHYWLGYGITKITQSPIMTGHWMMLIQVGLACCFLFAAIRRSSATTPALLAVTWLLHSRHTIQRMTGGLPRGWTPAIFAAFLYFSMSGKHRATLVVIALAVLLNPPGALIVGVAYGLVLVWRSYGGQGNARYLARGRLKGALALVPLFALMTFLVVERPPEIGQMVSLEEASRMPEFSRPRGRFPFLPLRPASEELEMFGWQAFLSRMNRASPFWRENTDVMVIGGLALIGAVGLRRRRAVFPHEVVLFGVASLITYSLSRLVAFKLFVPDRHIQIPMVFVFISLCCVGTWRALHNYGTTEFKSNSSQSDSRLRHAWASLVGLVLVGFLVWEGSGAGLAGNANFNYPISKRGGYYEWLRAHAPEDALVACHPTHCDGVQLLAERKAFVTTETSHPFYPRYNSEMRRRSELALRAQFSESLEGLVTLLEPEGITYFVFRRADFLPGALPKVTFFPPLDVLAKQLAARPSGKFVYYELSDERNSVKYPFVTFADSFSVVVDVRALSAYLRDKGWARPQSSLHSSMERHAMSRRTFIARGQTLVGSPS